MSSITAFMLNGHDSNYNMGKCPFCINSKLSKFTRLFNAVVYMAFLKSYDIYCLQMFNFDGQEDDQAAYDLSPSWGT